MGQLFNPPANFSIPQANETAALIQNAYQQFFQGANWHILPGYDLLAILSAKPDGWFAKDERFGFVARNQQTGVVFVTFRGTESPEDWMSNLSFPQVHHPWGAVEKGFSHLYDQCSALVKQTVTAANPTQLVVTGHSLGASLATLATADLTLAGRVPAMMNFASPRTGDLAFAHSFDQSVAERWRVVNTEDIVTTVPLATIDLAAHGMTKLHMFLAAASDFGSKLNYEHIGVPVCFTTHNGSIVANHAMTTYIAAL